VDAAGGVLDDDQGVDVVEQHGVHVDEVDGDYAAGLCGEELFPGRARAARGRVDPGIMQDLPHRGGRDPVAELAAQYRILVPEHQELGILGHLTAGQHTQAAQQTTYKQVDDREDHSGMISARKAPPATPDRVIEPHRFITGP
jgi:NADPH-dependent 2,4-dienoyl-CoA reductase/sulfur reductase-like enzyme